MEDSDCPGGRQPQKEIQGPRTSRLKVRRHSYDIKKVPLPPRPPPRQPPQPPPGPLFIEHDVSRRVIHINAADFKTLVQRLTGMDSTSSSSAPSSSAYSSCKDTSGGAISPLEGSKDPIIADHIHEVPHDPGVEKGIRAQRQPQNSPELSDPDHGHYPQNCQGHFLR
ncbi:hypothetical protein Nepgr_002882 [Nepenthes gracilis]|uniref:VQ domain-containing protein n=1 Tax=Nepenthes gracilis TaxID=150966 RepID=A0AAD3P9D9_NEPGR|nr:hypothetical protein Nepgr_002882 [Nepenthes gracilis]